MGSSPSHVSAATREIDAQINRQKLKEQQTAKLLILGPGQSGKSTILKQMRILHLGGFTDDDKAMFSSHIIRNMIHTMSAIIAAMKILDVEFDNPDLDIDAKLIIKAKAHDSSNFSRSTVLDTLANLFEDKHVKQIAQYKAEEMGIPDAGLHFLANIARLSQPDYIPTFDDILRCRIPTTGAVEITFKLKDLNFVVVDVGGQKTERKKWLHLFDNCCSIIFVTALSDYDLTMEEDPEMNRMKDALDLFKEIGNNKFFKQKPIILFLNKTDIFESKVKRKSIKETFPDYDGDGSFESSREHIKQAFRRLRKAEESGDRQVYAHYTCATDTGQIQFVLDATIHIITEKHVQSWGLC